MPETELLDLSAEDVDEATWDQLVKSMVAENPEEDAEPDYLTNSGCGGSSACYSDNQCKPGG